MGAAPIKNETHSPNLRLMARQSERGFTGVHDEGIGLSAHCIDSAESNFRAAFITLFTFNQANEIDSPRSTRSRKIT